MKELMTSQQAGTQPAVDVLTTCYASSKRTAKRLTHITLFDVNISSWKNISHGLNFVTQTKVADECDDPNAIHRARRFKRELIKKPGYYKNHFSLTEGKRAFFETALDVTIQDVKLCSLYRRLQNITMKNTLNKDHECL